MRPFLVLAASCFSALVARGGDWPQFMGPARDGVWAETGILDAFPAGGPKKLWSAPVRGGYSGPAVAGGKVFVTDYLRAEGSAANNPAERAASVGKERLLCLDAATGRELWKVEYDCAYKVSYPAGPRCTPTVDVEAGRVYALGTMGNLICVDLDGKPVWKKDFKLDYQAVTPVWGFSGHPLVYRNLLVCLVGGDGSVAVAFDKATGAEVWKALSAPEPGYSAPSVIRAGGVDQLIIWHAKSINGLDPLTGKKYWSVPLEPNYGMAIMMPRVSGDLLFAGGIGNKSLTLKLGADGPVVTEVARGKRANSLYPVNSTPVVEGDTLYGVDQPGQLRAVSAKTGDRLWATFKPVLGEDKEEDFRGGGSGTAFLTRNGDCTFLFGETGKLTLAKLTPEKYSEVGSAQLLEPTGEAFGRKVVWTAPAFANKCVYVRNDKEIACFSLAK